MRHRRTISSLAVAVVAGLVGTTAVATTRAPDARVARGRYLVAFAACGDCHTPLKNGPNSAEPDLSRFLSGHPESLKMSGPPVAKGAWLWAGAATNTAFAGPWGISYAANLTPDRNTGLGIWTEAMFIAAMRTGKHMGTSRPIMPPMPWESIKGATDEDLKSIYAYLRTIKPIVNHVPDYQPPAVATH
jgi:mono/diheme cytochrome c family protein